MTFYHPRPSYEERPIRPLIPKVGLLFQSTPLIRGATAFSGLCNVQIAISIHASHTRSDPLPVSASTSSFVFQSTPLIRGATSDSLPVRLRQGISIHAPHTRSDGTARDGRHRLRLISIHAPHTRSDCCRRHRHPARPYFNPRPSYEERPAQGTTAATACGHFNPHPSYEERLPGGTRKSSTFLFQSTPLIRGATLQGCFLVKFLLISIHAPHTRSDPKVTKRRLRLDISIHAPHTRSDKDGVSNKLAGLKFQSTPLIRGATSLLSSTLAKAVFQSTPLIRGATSQVLSPP